jgi:hypothetical protein
VDLSGGRWRLEVAPGWREVVGGTRDALDLLDREPAAVVSDGPRARLTLVLHERGLLVVKRSRLERASRWRRFWTLVRPSDGRRGFANQLRLRALDLPVPEPVLALERRRFGTVTDSWHVYRHVEGRPCGVGEAGAIAETLGRLHARGWVHRDPHVANFLRDGLGVVILDCGRARPSRSPWARAMDLVLLEKCCRGQGAPAPPIGAPRALVALARAHSRALVGWRSLKRRARAAVRGGVA